MRRIRAPSADATKRRKITTSAPVAPLDRFARRSRAGDGDDGVEARRRADAAKAFAETSNERTGWRRFFWGAGVKAARGAVDEDVGEIAEVQPVREQVALGRSPTSTRRRRTRRLGAAKARTAAAVGAEFARAPHPRWARSSRAVRLGEVLAGRGRRVRLGVGRRRVRRRERKTTRKNPRATPSRTFARRPSADAESASARGEIRRAERRYIVHRILVYPRTICPTLS